MTSFEVRNLARGALAGYLIDELDGREQEDGSLVGEGWRVRFVELDDAKVGRLKVRAMRVEVYGTGEKEAEVAAFLARKSMRGGG